MAVRISDTTLHHHKPAFAELNNLVSEKLGGQILFATDDWFAVADNLLKETEAEWREGEFTEYGKWMDGWETRRKRQPGHDWSIIKLGVPGMVYGVDADTSFFTGNYVPRVSVQAAVLTPEDEAKIPARHPDMGSEADATTLRKVQRLHSEKWTTIIPMSELGAGYQDTCHNYIPVITRNRWTHLRLNVYPDGGLARLKVFGYATPNWKQVSAHQLVDLVSVNMGGLCVCYSDAHYGHPRNLISPHRSLTMADGWETARRLDRPPVLEANEEGILQVPGFEWTVLRLGHTGKIRRIEIDTNHFKGNFPDSCKIYGGLFLPDEESLTDFGTDDSLWKIILPAQKLRAHTQHFYEEELVWSEPVSHVKVVIAPDGGISRVRLHGHIIETIAKL